MIEILNLNLNMEELMGKVKYYDLHYFYDRKNSGSYFMKTSKQLTTDEDIILEALDSGLLEKGDENCINLIVEITREEYEEATGLGG